MVGFALFGCGRIGKMHTESVSTRRSLGEST